MSLYRFLFTTQVEYKQKLMASKLPVFGSNLKLPLLFYLCNMLCIL